MRKRKGIYQGIDPAGNVTSDERWQILLPDDPAADDGVWQIESEVTRIAPFPRPRIESMAAQLVGARAGQIEWQTFSIHTRDGALEAGARFETDPAGVHCARFCWRRERHSGQREYVWKTDCEISYNSALLGTAAVWRSRLQPGESQIITMIDIDAVTLEPQPAQHLWSHCGFEALDTPLGCLSLARYEFGPIRAAARGRLWCDEDGVVCVYTAPDGSIFRLAAVNTTRK